MFIECIECACEGRITRMDRHFYLYLQGQHITNKVNETINSVKRIPSMNFIQAQASSEATTAGPAPQTNIIVCSNQAIESNPSTTNNAHAKQILIRPKI